MNKDKSKEGVIKPADIIWHKQTERILKDWAELSSCYRYMHDIAYSRFRTKNLWFTLPVIILTTLTGTANFSQSSFKETSFFEYVPLMIGGVNLLSGMISTIHQTLKYSTLEEGHRISGMAFGKLSRNIRVELNLPVKERSTTGSEFLFSVRAELDRLLEQSPQIPSDIIKAFEKKFSNSQLYKPEIININGVEIYEDKDKISELLGETATNLKATLQEPYNNYERNKKLLNDELNSVATYSSAKKGKEIFERNLRNQNHNIKVDITPTLEPGLISDSNIDINIIDNIQKDSSENSTQKDSSENSTQKDGNENSTQKDGNENSTQKDGNENSNSEETNSNTKD